MRFRIYVDESGTHDDKWLILGMLFVPDHGALHSALCRVKEEQGYFNKSPKRKARFKELHLTEFRSPRDVNVAKAWIDCFIAQSCYYRSVVVDWSVWDGSHFGGPFDPDALKRRRAYKKWAEMLLHPELKEPTLGEPIYHARLLLDKLRVMYGYDVLEHLRYRFTENYEGESPFVETFEHIESWRDANQCLQLCDLLTGGLHQSLVPARKPVKLEVRDYLAAALQSVGVRQFSAGFWRGYVKDSLRKHFPKFSVWFWKPPTRKERRQRRR